MNGFIIADLAELGATEAAPLMEEAFAVERVDLSVGGDWEDIQIELGLLAERKTIPPLRTRRPPADGTFPPEPESKAGPLRQAKPEDAAKTEPKWKSNSKRKMAARSRKRNRKR